MVSTSSNTANLGVTQSDRAIFPLSYNQKQLWFLAQLDADGAGYNVPNAYLIQGFLQKTALERSFRRLIQRHQALRTAFRTIDGQPVQIVADTVELEIDEIDLSHLPATAREAKARKIADADANLSFDLTRLPLWRITLIKLSDTTHWLLLTIHHIVFDGWSSEILFNELVTLYESDCQGETCQLPELTMQPSDFARWQQQRLQGEFLDNLLNYWTQKLSRDLQPLELPTDFPRPAQPSYQGATRSIQLSESLAQRLRVISRQRKTTLFMTLLAAFKLLLFRYTAQSDIAVGTPIANRSRPEQAGLVGFLVNTLVLRTRVSDQQSFWDLLDQVRMTSLEAYDHQDMPFDLLVQTLRPERDLSYNPLFQVMFQLHNQSPSHGEQRTLAFDPLDLETRSANFDLTLEVEEVSDGLVVEIEYSIDLFEADTIQRMLDHFKALLEGIVANPQQAIGRLPLLTPDERYQLLNNWNRGQDAHKSLPVASQQSPNVALTLSLESKDEGIVGQLVHHGDLAKAGAILSVLEKFSPELRRIAADPNYTPPEKLVLEGNQVSQIEIAWGDLAKSQNAPIQCLHQYFTEQARRAPDNIALCHRDQQLTYGEVNAKVNQIAHCLLAQGVQPDMPVGVCFERSLEMVIALLAVLKAGGAYLPLDPGYPQERLEYMMQDAQVEIALTQSYLEEKLLNIPKSVLCLDQHCSTIETYSQEEPTVEVGLHQLAYIIYTSGSTGKPKGVMIEHQAVAHFLQAAMARYSLTSSDCVLQFASISFDVAVEEIFVGLAAGAKLHLRTDDMISTPSQFLRSCYDWGITVLNLPTAYWHQLMTDAQIQLPPTVRLVIIGGERALPSLIKTWQQQVGDYPRLINAYGPTESTVTATSFVIDRRANIRQEVPIGKPFLNTETYILDAQRQLLPVGIPGELHIGGQSLARGYLNRPDLTQLKFVPHPFSNKANAKLYKTGDWARYLPDGNIEFLGRIDKQVKIRGFRIELGEIETALLQYPGVRETTVMATADNPSNPRLIAYIVAAPERPISTADLRGFLQQQLPSYMVPSSIVALERLPLTPNGKVDVSALPVPSLADMTEETVYVAPRTPLEDTLAGIWAKVLELPKVSVQDSFFELGGHSLQAIQTMAMIVNELDIELPISALFQAPTVEAMAQQLVKAGGKVPWTPLVPLQPMGSKRPFFAIHGGHGEVLFYQALSECLGKDQPFYALRALGNDYPDIAHQRVEDMAACYIEAIRRVQPEGPYFLGGTSLGGVVAFEMAQQLRDLGQMTTLLVMFDTGGFGEFIWPLPLYQRVINLFRYIPKYGLSATWKRVLIRLLKLFHSDSAVEFYRATGELPKQSSDVLAVWETVWAANLEALEQYTPQYYSGKITLLGARDDGDTMWNAHRKDYGWGRYAEGGVERYDLPGTHVGMFQNPHVRQLAIVLDQLFEQAA